MRVKTVFRVLRILSAVVLFFFLWTFGPIWQVAAFAATPQGQGSSSKGQGKTAESRPKTAGDRFEQALDSIREKIGKAEEKASKDQDAAAEVAEVKARRAEVEAADAELKAEFAETEKKLKDAKLPQVILDRHTAFVKNYTENLAQLRFEIDDIDKAKTTSDRKAKIEKARLHLESVKPPKKHVPLDPNNLPFKARKVNKAREPRLRKEDYKRDFPQQKSQGKRKIANSRLLPDLLASQPQHKPVLLAFNESASDIPLQLPRPSGNDLPLPMRGVSWGEGGMPQSALSESAPFLLAQAADLPSQDDLSESAEVQFTPAIRDLAAQLDYSPVKICEWVRNSIEFVPTYGSIQGADMCLQSQQCNSFDMASLLLALLRVSNIPAHYVYGTIEVPIDKVRNWVGGFTDPRAALNFIASGNIPAVSVISGGTIKAVRMEHVWVEAYIPYGNYRGAIMDQSLKTWIPMDGSFKQYTYTNGFDITATVPFSQDAYLSQVQTQNAVHYYQSQIQSYLDTNMPDTSIVDVKGYREVTPETYHFLPSTLPYVTVAQLGKFSSVSDGVTAKVTFSISNSAGSSISYTATTAELAGKRITVSYIPATTNDETLIANYGGFLYDVPAYMLNLKPVLRVEGAIKLTGDPTTLGSEQSLTMQFTQSNGNTEIRDKMLLAGAYYAIGLDLQGINENVLGKRNYNLTNNVLSQTAGTLGNDDLIGEHLFILATTYFLANDKVQKAGAKLFNVATARTISEGITSFTLRVSSVFGMPKSAMPSGINMDVAMAGVTVSARDGNTSKELAYMDMHGLVGSYHEHDIFEKIDGFSSVSAVKALQTAAASGIPIQKITGGNIGQLLPTLQVSAEIKTDIQNAVNAGKEVTISQSNVQINDWNGAGYIVKDPTTGAGAYMISGGLAGSDSTSQQDGMQIVEINKEPLGWVKDNIDPQTRKTIATAAELEAILQDKIKQEAVDLISQYTGTNAYDKVGTCVGVVRRAYWAGGICLDEWSYCPQQYNPNNLVKKNGIATTYMSGNQLKYYSGVKILYDLANKLNINKSVRMTHDPLIGDMVFFQYTSDPTKHEHVGVVVSATGANGTMQFVDATETQGVKEKSINFTYPSVGLSPTLGRLNDALLQQPCTRCYAGELFGGFGTVRDTSPQATGQ